MLSIANTKHSSNSQRIKSFCALEALDRQKHTYSEHPLVSVIILNYNGKNLLVNCLHSLEKSTYPRTHILIVDNASTDGSVEVIRQEFPYAELICNNRNLYFSKGNNIGIARALKQGADYLLILNNDTELAPDCISKLVDFMESNPSVGGCQPLLCFMDKPFIIASAGCRVAISGKAWDKDFRFPVQEEITEPVEVTGITGGAMLLRNSVIRKVGMFCDRFKMYFEDVDLSLRIREHGYSLYCVPKARVRHKVSATTNRTGAYRRDFLCERNSYWIVLLNFPLLKIIYSYFLHIPAVMVASAYNFCHGNFRLSLSTFFAFVIGLFSFIVYMPVRLLESLHRKRSYAFWSFIETRVIYPPAPPPLYESQEVELNKKS